MSDYIKRETMAEEVLRRAVQLAPPDYVLVKANLEHLRTVRSELAPKRPEDASDS